MDIISFAAAAARTRALLAAGCSAAPAAMRDAEGRAALCALEAVGGLQAAPAAMRDAGVRAAHSAGEAVAVLADGDDRVADGDDRVVVVAVGVAHAQRQTARNLRNHRKVKNQGAPSGPPRTSTSTGRPVMRAMACRTT